MRSVLRTSPTVNSHLLILILICKFAYTPVMAQSAVNDSERQPDFPGLDVQAVIGWDGRVEFNAPVPISFLISNQSNEVLEGQFILREPETNREINLGDVFVGPGSVRRFSSVQALPDWNDCVATYTDGSVVFWTRPLPLMTGKDFSEDVSYLLFVDDGGRTLQLPVAADSEASSSEQAAAAKQDPSGQSGERFTPRSGFGRSVQPVSVKSWQVPQHPGPLTVAQGMLFSETARVDMLNDPQWDAIGRWICLGGTVFVHDSSQEVLERIKKAAPFGSQPTVLVDKHQTSRCGLGSIREYSGRLLSADDPEPILKLLEAASKLSRYNVMSIPENLPQTYTGTSNANYTRLMVLAVFSIYALFSGVVTLLLFRSNRRRVLVYIVSVVSVACLAAALLGSYLRNSRGDLRWQTVTLGNPGGAIQIAQIQLQSAGGRNTQVAVRGEDADLQLLRNKARDRRSYYSQRVFFADGLTEGAVGYKPFSLHPNLLQKEPNVFGIGVPITPWGVRQSVATAYDASLQDMDIQLQFRPAQPATSAATTYSPDSWSCVIPGQWTLSITNRLPFDLNDCRLVIAASVPRMSQNLNTLSYGQSTSTLQFFTGRGEFGIGGLPVSASETRSTSNIVLTGITNLYYYGSQDTAEIKPAFPGASEIWFTARVQQSPMIKIDDQHSDFEPFDELHHYMQRVAPEEIPQEWRDAWQQHVEQEMTAAREQLKLLETQGQVAP